MIQNEQATWTRHMTDFNRIFEWRINVLNHRANLTRPFKTEYQPSTSSTTEQGILNQVPCSFYARTPGERRTPTCHARTLM